MYVFVQHTFVHGVRQCVCSHVTNNFFYTTEHLVRHQYFDHKHILTR